MSEIERLNENLMNLWEIESVSTTQDPPIVRIAEQMALNKVKQSFTFESQMNRVKNGDPILQKSYKMTFQKLDHTEKRLEKIPELGKAYNDCLERYVEKGYVVKVPVDDQPVLRPDKDTTKTRFVSDAATKFKGGPLNDRIYQVPKLQRDLFDALLRFRRYSIAVVCAIEEMYLCIGIAHADKPYHRLLWRGWTRLAAQMSMNSIGSFSL